MNEGCAGIVEPFLKIIGKIKIPPSAATTALVHGPAVRVGVGRIETIFPPETDSSLPLSDEINIYCMESRPIISAGFLEYSALEILVYLACKFVFLVVLHFMFVTGQN